MKNRVTPEKIEDLKYREMFVFGSNLAGRHGAGAAKLAYDKGWTKYGIGYGPHFKSGLPFSGSFAIPTKGLRIERIPVSWIRYYVTNFIEYAEGFPDLTFLVTEIGCGLAGYGPEDIAPLFDEARDLEQIHLPQRFWDIIT